MPESLSATTPPFFVGDWRAEPARHRLVHGEAVVTVEPKVMAVLVALAQRPEQMATREQLFETVWAGTVVGDDALTLAVSKLRRALGDTPRNPQYIETIPKVGYRLMVPVAPAYAGDSATDTWVPTDPPSLADPPAALPVARPTRWLLPGLSVLLLALLGVWWLRPAIPAPALRPNQILTSLPGRETHARLSPDGTHLAFAWHDPETRRWHLFAKSLDAQTPAPLTTAEAHDQFPAWSPDGQRLAFIRHNAAGGCQLMTIPLVGGQARPLDDCLPGTQHLDWSPNGQWLAFSATEAGQTHLALLHAETLEKRRLPTPPPGSSGDSWPRFGADGQHLVFLRTFAPGSTDLFRIDLDGTDANRLTTDAALIWGHTAPAADGTLYFSSNRSGMFQLWRFQPDTAPTWLPTAGGPTILAPTAARHPGPLVFEQWSYDTNIWQISADTSGAARLWNPSSRWDATPQVSPDGQQVAFTSMRAGPLALWVSDRDGNHTQRLTFFEKTHVTQPRWSPDGQRLAFAARPDANADLFMVAADGGPPQRLTATPAQEAAPVWSADGASLYYASTRSGSWQLWQHRLADGTDTQLTTNGGYVAQPSPDGKALYYTKRTAPGLWHRPLADTTETLLLPDLSTADSGNWLLADNGLYYLRTGPSGLELAHFDLATQQTRTLRPLAVRPLNPSLARLPDGTFFITLMDETESDLVLIRDA